MVKKDVLIVNSASKILELKKKYPNKLDEDLISFFIKDLKHKNKEDNLSAISYVSITLKFRNQEKKLSTREVIQKVIDYFKKK